MTDPDNITLPDIVAIYGDNMDEVMMNSVLGLESQLHLRGWNQRPMLMTFSYYSGMSGFGVRSLADAPGIFNNPGPATKALLEFLEDPKQADRFFGAILDDNFYGWAFSCEGWLIPGAPGGKALGDPRRIDARYISLSTRSYMQVGTRRIRGADEATACLRIPTPDAAPMFEGDRNMRTANIFTEVLMSLTALWRERRDVS